MKYQDILSSAPVHQVGNTPINSAGDFEKLAKAADANGKVTNCIMSKSNLTSTITVNSGNYKQETVTHYDATVTITRANQVTYDIHLQVEEYDNNAGAVTYIPKIDRLWTVKKGESSYCER